MVDLRSHEICESLCCPDDQARLIVKTDHLQCSKCCRRFLLLANNFAEILPSKFPEWNLKENENKKSEKSYQNIFSKKLSWDRKADGWGDLSTSSPGYRAFVKKERDKIKEFLNPSPDMIGIEVSGGVGNYSIHLSDGVKIVVHCELEVQSILSAYNESKERDNVLFIRTPYLNLPFNSATFDYAICTDTLERGWNHEVKLLAEIVRILKKGGKAVVDFHNTRLFFGNPDICSYSQAKIRNLLLGAGVQQYSVYPFGWVPSKLVPSELFYPVLDRMFKLFLIPCRRYVVVFNKT